MVYWERTYFIDARWQIWVVQYKRHKLCIKNKIIYVVCIPRQNNSIWNNRRRNIVQKIQVINICWCYLRLSLDQQCWAWSMVCFEFISVVHSVISVMPKLQLEQSQLWNHFIFDNRGCYIPWNQSRIIYGFVSTLGMQFIRWVILVCCCFLWYAFFYSNCLEPKWTYLENGDIAMINTRH